MSLTWLNEPDRDRRDRGERKQERPDLFAMWESLSAAVHANDWDAVREISPVLTDATETHAWLKYRPYNVGTMYYSRAPEDVRLLLDAFNATVKVAKGRGRAPKVR